MELFKNTARALFYAHGYHDVSVDQIAGVANASRATFYLHFKSKRAVLMAILMDDLAEQVRLYERLAELPRLDRPTVLAWLREYRHEIEEREASLPLFSVAFEGTAERNPITISHRDTAIATLGKRWKAFDLRELPEHQFRVRRARAFLMIMMMEQVAMAFSFSEGSPDIATGLDILADDLLAFLVAGEDATSRPA